MVSKVFMVGMVLVDEMWIGEMLLEFADALDFAVVNTYFKKEVRKMITYETKACKTVIDFFLIRKSERKLVRDVKVVHEECINPFATSVSL